MNKYALVIILAAFLMIVTYAVDVSTSYTLASDINQAASAPENTNLVTVFSMLGTLFGMLAFQVEGIPVFINLFVFWPISLGLLVLILDIIKDLVPFT